nr:hypothetical protein [uncultured Roseateles sp.]
MALRGSVYFSDRTLEVLGDAASRSDRIAQIVDRYAVLMGQAKGELLEALSVDELQLARKALIAMRTKGRPAAELLDEIDGRLATFALASLDDTTMVMERIRSMSALAKMALADWIEGEKTAESC